jgi:hypothetical protein
MFVYDLTGKIWTRYCGIIKFREDKFSFAQKWKCTYLRGYEISQLHYSIKTLCYTV